MCQINTKPWTIYSKVELADYTTGLKTSLVVSHAKKKHKMSLIKMIHSKAVRKIRRVILGKIKCVNNDDILEEIF